MGRKVKMIDRNEFINKNNLHTFGNNSDQTTLLKDPATDELLHEK